jgi:DnaJ-class molecular chaperone
MAKRDYYAVLGVSRSATAEEIRRAFRELARRYHPDVNKDPAAQGRYLEVQEAYDVLSDAEKRASYDRFGHVGARGPGVGGGEGEGIGAEELGSMFEAFFGGRTRGPFGGAEARPGRRGKPAELRHEIEVDFLVAVLGGTREIEIRRGESTQRVSVTIPAGLESGSKLRVRGVGQSDALTGRAGDMILTVHVRPHGLFRRGEPGRGESAQDVYLELPVTIAEAALGGTVEIPTPTGRASVSVSAGAASGRRLRLRGQGCRGTPSGDLYAVIMVHPPPAGSLDVESRALLERLGAATPVRESPQWGMGVAGGQAG